MHNSSLIRPPKILLAALLGLALTGCETSVQNAGADAPEGSMVVRVGGYSYYVMPLRMKDGTECVVVAHSRVAIACDFAGKAPHAEDR